MHYSPFSSCRWCCSHGIVSPRVAAADIFCMRFVCPDGHDCRCDQDDGHGVQHSVPHAVSMALWGRRIWGCCQLQRSWHHFQSTICMRYMVRHRQFSMLKKEMSGAWAWQKRQHGRSKCLALIRLGVYEACVHPRLLMVATFGFSNNICSSPMPLGWRQFN